MIKLELKRIDMGLDCTLGVININNEYFCCTLENPWLNNEKNVSCIPAGNYYLEKVNSPKFGKVYEVKDVKDRTHILFHAGNIEPNTQGCILLGNMFGEIQHQRGVANSKTTVEKFNNKLDKSEKILLIITEA